MSKLAPPPVLHTPQSTSQASKPAVQTQTTPHAQSRTRAPRLHGLDTLRVLAVFLVIIYHFVPSALPGGFVGVDVFFVLSGFLITSLLVQEWRRDRRISLKEFWRRRARRILPALGVMVVVVIAIVGAIGGDILVGLPAQIFGALTFSSNWVYIATGSSYESALTPQLFANLWSLAVEEQFYVLWPLAVVGGYILTKKLSGRRSRAALAGLSGVLAFGSAALMFSWYSPGTDPSRVYYGTDTHLFGLMLGAVLAFILVPHREYGWPTRFPLISRLTQKAPQRALRVGHAVVAAVSLLVIVASAFLMEFSDSWTYRGGLLLVDFATVALIAVIVCNQGAASRIEHPALAWIGKRSYSLYLWHWPILVIVVPLMSDRAAGTDVNALIFAVAFTLTFVASALSYRFVEQPVMRGGFRSTCSQALAKLNCVVDRAVSRKGFLSDDPASRDWTRTRAIAMLTTMVVAFGAVITGATAAVTQVPKENSIEASINEGADLLAQYEASIAAEESAAEIPDDSGSVDPSGVSNEKASSGDEGAVDDSNSGSQETKKPSKPVKPKGKEITIIGDSVTLAAIEPLTKSFKGAQIDAKVSRGMNEAPKIMRALKKKDKLRDFVVISLATNSIVRQPLVDKILEIAGDRKVIFVTGHADRSWVAPTNKLLTKNAKLHDNVVLANWTKAIDSHEDELARDGIHPGAQGAKRYAKVISEALTRANG